MSYVYIVALKIIIENYNIVSLTGIVSQLFLSTWVPFHWIAKDPKYFMMQYASEYVNSWPLFKDRQLLV